MVFRRLCVVVFAVLAPLASVLASPAAAQEEWPQYSRDDAAGCDVTTSEDGAEERSCDDGSYGARWADGSGYWYDAASGCQIDIDPAGAIVYDSCADGGGDGSDDGSSNQIYDEATGCWINDYGDGNDDRNCDDGSWGGNSGDGSGYWFDGPTGCYKAWDSSGAIVDEWCDDGGDDGGGGDGGGEQSGEYDEATGCWINSWDGGEEWNCDDGSRGSRYDDGSSSEYDPATGCETQRSPDGSEYGWCDNGSNWNVDEQGNRSESTYDEATGCYTETRDGSVETRCEVYDEATGCTTTTYSDGREDGWCEDGSSWNVGSDGNRSESTYDEATGCNIT